MATAAVPMKSAAKGISADAKPFKWDDALLLEDQLTEDERAIRDAAHQYCQEKLFPARAAGQSPRKIHREIMNEFGEMGFLGATLAPTHGCADVGYVAYGLIAREVERMDFGYRRVFTVQSTLVMFPIYAFGSDAQKRSSCPSCQRRIHRLLRLHRTGRRLRPRRMITRAAWVYGGYLPVRREDLDDQRPDRRCVRRLGQGRCRLYPWLCPGKRQEGLRPRRRSTANSACAPRSPALSW